MMTTPLKVNHVIFITRWLYVIVTGYIEINVKPNLALGCYELFIVVIGRVIQKCDISPLQTLT